MTLYRAVRTWNRLKSTTNVLSLQSPERHALVHDVSAAVNRAVKDGRMTYDRFEALTSRA